ncbi:MAG TPA: FHA domain-containing protein, partial [Anaerolineae bacterium]
MELRLSWNDLDSGELQEVTAPLPITIGRDADSTIELSHRAISRHHARLEEDESGNVVIKDLDSSNGVFIGRQRVTEAVLDDGDSFQLGPFKITIAVVPPATPVTAAAPDATVVFEVEDVPSRAEAPAGQHESELMLRWTDPITKQSQEQVVMPPVS